MNLQDTLLAYGEWLDTKKGFKSDEADLDDTWDNLAEDFIREWKADPDKAKLPSGDTEDPVQVAMEVLVEQAQNGTASDDAYQRIRACEVILEHHRGAPQVVVHGSIQVQD